MTKFLTQLLFLMASLALLSGCAKMTLAWADLKPAGPVAAPQALGTFAGDAAVTNSSDWEARKPALQKAFESEVYGVFPDASSTRILGKLVLNDNAFDGRGVLEEWTLSADATFNGRTVETKPFPGRDGFLLEVALPKEATGPVPIILMETFCPSWEVVPDPAVSRPSDAREMGGGPLGGVMTYVFGRYICTPPFEMILERGYGVAVLYPNAVPDQRDEGLAELRRLSAGYENDDTRWGAVAAWGWLFSRAVDALEQDPRIDANAIATWGHSRYGKAALVAAAWDPRIAAVIAHQSGTGGASLNREKKGESVSAITSAYPHWFAKSYAEIAGEEETMDVDQHLLLALIAPRPVLLGNARRDVWSDPNGAFRAALGADPVYELLGSDGLSQLRLDEWRPQAGIAFWLRPGTHGVVKEDWPAFLEFLDAHLRD